MAPYIIWFEPAEAALADPVRFLAYLMTFGTVDEIAVVRRHVSLDDFREALEQAPPGIMDERSWAYWNTKLGATLSHLCHGGVLALSSATSRLAVSNKTMSSGNPRKPRQHASGRPRNTQGAPNPN